MRYLAVVVASVLFGIFPSIQDGVLLTGVTPLALVVVCNGISGLLGLAGAAARREELRVGKRQLLDLAMLGVIGLFLTDYLLNVAYTMIPVGYVTMIHFMYPSLVCIAMAVFFREKLNGWKAAAMVCSAAGLAFLAGGGFTGRPVGILVAFLTGVAYAFYMIASDRSSVGGLPVFTRVFYSNLFVVLTALCAAAAGVDGKPMLFPQTGSAWLGCLAVGAMLCAGTYLINIGIIRLGAGTASFIYMVEPITSLAVSAAVYRYHIGALNLLGCALILGSLAFAARGDSKAEAKAAG